MGHIICDIGVKDMCDEYDLDASINCDTCLSICKQVPNNVVKM